MRKDENGSHVSVGLMLTQRSRMVLVKDHNGGWGIPAGRCQIETLYETAIRETEQETGLEGKRISFSEFDADTHIIPVKHKNRISLGIILYAHYAGLLPRGEWSVTDPGKDIVSARAFNIRETAKLIDDKRLRREQYNLPPIMDFIISRFSRGHPGRYLKDSQTLQWLKRHQIAKDIPGLECDLDQQTWNYLWPLELGLVVHNGRRRFMSLIV